MLQQILRRCTRAKARCLFELLSISNYWKQISHFVVFESKSPLERDSTSGFEKEGDIICSYRVFSAQRSYVALLQASVIANLLLYMYYKISSTAPHSQYKIKHYLQTTKYTPHSEFRLLHFRCFVSKRNKYKKHFTCGLL